MKISIPKFSFTSTYQLEDVLPQMGMPDAFHPAIAHFSGMSGGLCISKVIHKALIEANEKGSEAAAVTTVIMIEKVSKKEIRYKADRPFMFLICDKQTELIYLEKSLIPSTYSVP